MGLQDVPSGERVHIGFFGRRNAGKSSLVNAVTGQELSVVSDQKGTTTDPVTKAMELLPLGPVVIMDTPGFDDVGALGAQRIRAARKTLDRTDLAVLVTDQARIESPSCEAELIGLFREKQIPYLVVRTKADLGKTGQLEEKDQAGGEDYLFVSSLTGEGIWALKEKIALLGKQVKRRDIPLVRDLLSPGDLVILVLPQDKAAPRGRLILPEQMMIRDILDGDGRALCVKQTQLSPALSMVKGAGENPALVITDSQVFDQVAQMVPPEIPLTSFSILMARYKGVLEEAVKSVAAIDRLKEGDRILISEGCTHHRQCGDIGTVKLPALLRSYTGKTFHIETSSGLGFPDELRDYALVIHCGGCMLGEREMLSRREKAAAAGVPFTNYGTAIAYMRGILTRSLTVLDRD